MSKPIKLPSGRWRVRWLDADGKRQSDTFATFDLARAALRRLEVGADEDRERRDRIGTAAMTVTDAGERFLATRKKLPDDTDRRFAERGRAHRRNFDHHITPHIGEIKLCDLTPKVLRVWVETLAAKKTARRGEKNEGGRTLSAATIRGVASTLCRIAVANDVELRVRLGGSLAQKRRTRPKALQCVEDVRALLAACRDPWFKVAAAIACYADARFGEVASLRWRHIGDETITLAESWGGPLKCRAAADEESARVVPLDPELAAILAAWREVTKGQDGDHVVLVHGRRPLLESDCLARRTRSACKRAGVTPLTFHGLRATYATIVSNQGLPIAKLQALLGHSDARTTGVYVRPESAHAALDPRARISMRGHDLATAPAPAAATLN